MVWSFLLVAVVGLLGGVVQVPYVALGPGPTFDTLGVVNGSKVVDVQGQETFPTKGHLTMTTVSLTDSVTLFGALGLWASGRYSLAPREEYFKPGESQQDVQKENVQQFTDSQTNAQVAALRYLGYPMKVLVGTITKDSPVNGVLQAGDRLVSVNGKKVSTSEDVQNSLKDTKPGQAIPVAFQHGTEAERTATVTLGRSEDRAWGFMGITPLDRPDVPFQVKISLSDVGGPSAGLMFALAIVDKLTPDGLDNGQWIAGTGEIDDRGNVKPIGGIPFKMIAARETGATVFLAPAANCSEAKQRVPDGLRLVKVNNLGDAVSALQALKAGKDVPGC
nr:PDZ domain-containing protein [Kutzneria albida]